MADDYQVLRDLLTNGIGGAGTGAAIVYLWLRYGTHDSVPKSGINAAELRAWMAETRDRLRDLEATMNDVERVQHDHKELATQGAMEIHQQTELLRRIDDHLYNLLVRIDRLTRGEGS